MIEDHASLDHQGMTPVAYDKLYSRSVCFVSITDMKHLMVPSFHGLMYGLDQAEMVWPVCFKGSAHRSSFYQRSTMDLA